MKILTGEKMRVMVAAKAIMDYSRLNSLVGDGTYPDENFKICQIYCAGGFYEIHYQLNAQNFLYIEAVTGHGQDVFSLFDCLNTLKKALNAKGICFVTKLAGLANQAEKFGFEIVGLYMMKKYENDNI